MKAKTTKKDFDYYKSKGWSFEYVPAVGMYGLFNGGKLVLWDNTACITEAELVEKIESLH